MGVKLAIAGLPEGCASSVRQEVETYDGACANSRMSWQISCVFNLVSSGDSLITPSQSETR